MKLKDIIEAAGHQSPLFLLSNDDGYEAPGLQALANRLSQMGDVWVAAPHEERSATSQMINIWKPLRVNQMKEQHFAIEGSPSDCMMLGLQWLVPRKPDVVITGINRGGNIGTDTQYSGTVAAATEASIVDIPAIATSLCGSHPKNYQMAADIVAEIVEQVDLSKIAGKVLNVNIPDLPRKDIKGLKQTSLAKRCQYPKIEKKHDPRGREYYWHGAAEYRFEGDKDSDFLAVNDGFVSASVLGRTRYEKEATDRLELEGAI